MSSIWVIDLGQGFACAPQAAWLGEPLLNDAVMELRSGFMTPFAVLLSLDSASQVLIIPSGMQH